jgi:hypothetical protein
MLSPDERAKILREAPPRTWIAFPADESEVVAQAQTYEETVSIAESKGVNDPVLLMTPESWVPMVLGSAFAGHPGSL